MSFPFSPCQYHTYIVKVISSLCIQRKLHSANTIALSLNYISKNFLYILFILCVFKAIIYESRKKVVEVEIRKMKILQNKVRIKIITALRSSTILHL